MSLGLIVSLATVPNISVRTSCTFVIIKWKRPWPCINYWCLSQQGEIISVKRFWVNISSFFGDHSSNIDPQFKCCTLIGQIQIWISFLKNDYYRLINSKAHYEPSNSDSLGLSWHFSSNFELWLNCKCVVKTNSSRLYSVTYEQIHPEL